MKNSFDLIIFDWDGTLIDSINWITDCLIQAGEYCQFKAPERQAARHVIGLSSYEAMRKLYPEADEGMRQQLVKHYSEAYFSKQLSAEDLFEGVLDMLWQLKDSGYQLAVATGKTRRGLNQALTDTGTTALFTTTRCADETASKPDPKMLYEIMQHTNTNKQRTLMVGDSVHDLQMAKNADISAIAVCCGAHTEEFLRPFQPLHCLQQPTELLAYFQD